MTGHSSGQATSDEQKILANLIFYCNQLLFNTYTTNDASAQDFAKPNKPSVSISNNNFTWSATDNGSTYKYYVESYSKNDTTSSGLLDKSTTKSLTVTTGVKSYRYILDNDENTKVTTSTGTKTTSTSLALDGSHKYLHIIAIDGAGNVSDTTTYKIPDATITFNGKVVLLVLLVKLFLMLVLWVIYLLLLEMGTLLNNGMLIIVELVILLLLLTK